MAEYCIRHWEKTRDKNLQGINHPYSEGTHRLAEGMDAQRTSQKWRENATIDIL